MYSDGSGFKTKMISSQVMQEEQDQILQTIQMFEVIAEANPDDCQSLEILKEAYWRLDRQSEAIAITRKLADAFVRTGQFSSAMLEYEDILQKEPDSPDVIATLNEMEAKLNRALFDNQPNTVSDDPAHSYHSSLIAINGTLKSEEEKPQIAPNLDSDGNEPLAKFLMQHQLAPDDLVISSLDRVRKHNRTISGQAISVALIHELCKDGTVEQDRLISGILDRTKFAYIPLEYYDVDRQIVKMLPESLTLNRLIVPFDIVSRTVMVAMANPFDVSGKEAVQQLLDYNIQWHLTTPHALNKVLRESYHLT